MTTTIIWTIAILTVLGVVLAVVLFFVAEKFKVEEDPRIDGCSLGVEEHTCAEAAGAVVALQDVVVLASLAAFPELVILCELGERHGHVSHGGVEFHHGQ